MWPALLIRGDSFCIGKFKFSLKNKLYQHILISLLFSNKGFPFKNKYLYSSFSIWIHCRTSIWVWLPQVQLNLHSEEQEKLQKVQMFMQKKCHKTIIQTEGNWIKPLKQIVCITIYCIKSKDYIGYQIRVFIQKYHLINLWLEVRKHQYLTAYSKFLWNLFCSETQIN